MKQKLHIIFDRLDKPMDLGNDDLYIHNKTCLSNVVGGGQIYSFSIMKASHDERPAIFLNSLFDNTDPLHVVKNTLYGNFFLQVFSFLQQLSDIVESKKYESVVLYGGSKYVYVSFERSEGEGSPYHYYHSWLFNSLAYQYLRKKNYTIEWKHKHSYIILKTHNIIRERILRYNEFQKCIVQFFKNQKVINGLSEELRDSTEILALAKLEGQSNYISNLLKQTGKQYVILAPKRYNDRSLIIKDYLTFKDIINHFLMRREPRINNSPKQISFLFDGCSFCISQSAFKRATSTTYLLYLNAIKRVENKIRKGGFHNVNYCVTSTAYGRSMLQYTEAIKRLGLKHINLQYVAMGQRNIPIVDLADEYYLFEKGSLKFYKEKSNIFRLFMPSLSIEHNHLTKNNKPVVIIYTQPDSFTPQYLDLLKRLFMSLGEDLNKVNILIKLHYRQDREIEFKELASAYGVDVVKNERSVVELMKSSDICVSMTSAILFEATFFKVPAIIYWEDDETYKYNFENETGFPSINYVVRNVSQLKDKILNMDKEDYSRRYDNYMIANNSLSLKDIFR